MDQRQPDDAAEDRAGGEDTVPDEGTPGTARTGGGDEAGGAGAPADAPAAQRRDSGAATTA